jgi:hypothetical protein
MTALNITPEDIIVNDEIIISPELWIELNNNLERDEIKQLISDAMTMCPLPYRNITLQDATVDFNKLMMGWSGETIVESEWFSRYDYKYPLSNVLIKSKNIGGKSSDYFHQEARWRCDRTGYPSPYRTWHSAAFRWTLLGALWSMKVKHVDSTVMRSIIALRKYIASQYRPTAARDIINHFGAKDVLDFSSGWGDRLSGFLASGATSYTGIDPNASLIDGYKGQIAEFCSSDKTVTMIHGCAEDKHDIGMVDLIMTSPPYFNVELYTTDENQSYKKYPQIEQWLDGFLFKAIENSWEKLRVGGHMAINISDVYRGELVKICDPMNDFIAQFPDSEYHGCYGYGMRKRPNSGALKDKVGEFAEPMWIWKKV